MIIRPIFNSEDGWQWLRQGLLATGDYRCYLCSNLRRGASNFSNDIGDPLTGTAAASIVRVQVPLMNSSRRLPFRILPLLALM